MEFPFFFGLGGTYLSGEHSQAVYAQPLELETWQQLLAEE